MRSIWIFIFLSGISKQSFATDTLKCPGGYYDSILAVQVYDFVEVEPSFPGGGGELSRFIQQNLIYPEVSEDVLLQLTSYVDFVVSEEGKLLQICIAHKTPEEYTAFDLEVIRVVTLMPDWIPGICNGNKVAVKYRIPVKVEID